MQISQQLKNLDRPRKSEMNRMEKIIAYYVHDLKLSDKDDDYRKLLELSNQLALAEWPRLKTAKFLEKKYGINRSKAYQAIRDAEELFGEVGKSNKEGLRYLQTEWYKKMSTQLMAEGRVDQAIYCRVRIDKINGLEDKKSTTIHVGKVLMPKQIIFTTDPKALEINRQMEEAEEAEYEEMEE